jgi:alkylated DNA repair dioxygenase AlkB
MSGCDACENCVILIKQCDQLRRQISLLKEPLKHSPPTITMDINTQTENLDTALSPLSNDNNAHSGNESDNIIAEQDDQLFKLFLESAPLQPKQTFAPAPILRSDIPAYVFPGLPFRSFSVEHLDKDTAYTLKVGKLWTAYYGPYPYSYGGITHTPNELPDCSYLDTIMKHVAIVMPELVFNSILVTKFVDGSDYLALHSDNEDSIVKDSIVATITLGEPRVVRFQSKSDGSIAPLTKLTAEHGSMYLMSRSSQEIFKHEVPKCPSSGMRISITLRHILPKPALAVPELGYDPEVVGFLSELQYAPDGDTDGCRKSPSSKSATTTPSQRTVLAATTPINHRSNPTRPTEKERSTTVYISSSLFRNMDEKKLSSNQQEAKVFSFPGATAQEMLIRLQSDRRFNTIDPNRVKQVFVLCGSNNVDKILSVPRSHWNSVIHDKGIQFSNHCLIDTTNDITNLGIFLHERMQESTINFINILPRASRTRNVIINDLNTFIGEFCDSHSYLNMVNTESTRNLFSHLGFRKDLYFIKKGDDNVHLTSLGVARLANHLKYTAHNVM